MHVSAIQFPRLSLRSWMTRGLLFSCLLLEIDPSVIGPRKRIPGEYPKRLLAEASRDWDYSAAAVALEDHFDPVVHAEEVRRTFFDEDDEEDRGEAENAEEEAMKTTTERSPNFEGTVSEEHLAILLPHVASAYDFLRIQFGHWLTDEAISDYLATLLEDVNSAQLKVTDASQDESSSDSKDRTARTKWRDLASLTEALEEPYQHLHHIRKEGRCGEPNRKVFRVSHFYPTNQIIYVPSDIVLHRCDLHSGCCDDEGSTCVPAEKKVVRQSFYVSLSQTLPLGIATSRSSYLSVFTQ
ncbi:hypothetical protein BV898_16637 [Hypsibius exemplaris]|uniref:Platelet-derived growth factor (PDGF) family profile domain-containing protein n=1 Tax=Hypsibius exemplaris TaxID=2072580 RepID=A0A9X6NG90_HYPEX|nr:hypothetical protein BV898_16637 [Hypsibius exemplaris]